MEDISPEQCVWGNDFIKTYMRHAKRRSYKNEMLHSSAIFSLIGQSLRDVWLRADQTTTDCRIHPFVVQSSGSGKNSVFSMMSTVAEAADMQFDSEGTASTAGIMGTVRQNGEVIKGDLAGNGFVAWKEAQTLLKSAQQTHSSDILEVMNMALDPDGEVDKTLSGGKLEYCSRSSMFCTTYDPEPDGQLDLITQGFLPRTLFYYRTVDEDFYDEVNQRRDSGLPRPNKTNETYVTGFEDDVEKLANTLKYIEQTVIKYGDIYHKEDSHYARADRQIDYFDGIEENVSIDPTPVLNEVLNEFPMEVRRRAMPFKTRMFDLCYKMSAAMAAISRNEDTGVYVSRIIKKKHVDKAKDLLRKYWRSTLKFIQDYMTYQMGEEMRKIETVIRQLSRRRDKVQIKDVMSELRIPKAQLKRNLVALEEMERIEANGTVINAADAEDKIIWKGQSS